MIKEEYLKAFSFAPHAFSTGDVCVNLRKLSAAERVRWLERMRSLACEESAWQALAISSTLLAMTLCNDQGERIFEDEDASKLEESIDAETLQKLADEAMRINGLGTKVEDQLKN